MCPPRARSICDACAVARFYLNGVLLPHVPGIVSIVMVAVLGPQKRQIVLDHNTEFERASKRGNSKEIAALHNPVETENLEMHPVLPHLKIITGR